jgi:hypothetical protein
MRHSGSVSIAAVSAGRRTLTSSLRRLASTTGLPSMAGSIGPPPYEAAAAAIDANPGCSIAAPRGAGSSPCGPTALTRQMHPKGVRSGVLPLRACTSEEYGRTTQGAHAQLARRARRQVLRKVPVGANAHRAVR